MPNHDFECPYGHRHEHFEMTWRTMPARRRCPECGAMAEKIFVGRWNGIHPDGSSMYGKYHPAFGCVVESYSHKQKLLKEYGAIEAADRTGGSRSYVTGDYSEAAAKKEREQNRPAPPASVQWADAEDIGPTISGEDE